MTTKSYAVFGAMALGLGLWGFWLGRASSRPIPPQSPAPSVVAAAVPQAAPEPPPSAAGEPTPAAAANPPAAVPEPPLKKRARPVEVRKLPAQHLPPASVPASMPAAELEKPTAAAPAAAPATPPPPPKPVETARVFTPEKPYETATPPKSREPQTATIPAGTLLTVRLREALSSESNSNGDTFSATLDQPLIIDGFVLAERGASARGHITDLARAGRVKGRSVLALELKSLTASDGQKIDLDTDAFRREGEANARKDATRAGVMTAIGAAIGAIAGGGKGAAIGAGVGGAAGAGTVLATRGEDAKLPAETRLTFRLKNPVTVTEKLN